MKQKKPRFEVDHEGMRALQAGREPWQLAKELISNCFDEAITTCEVTLKATDTRKALLTVVDDGKGFADIKDAWVLMGHTPKRGNPEVRGRFNIGEKEIISVAISAQIETSGYIISFPKAGGRYIRKSSNPQTGTKILCVLSWGNRQTESVIENLKKLLPPKGIIYKVNGITVHYSEPYKVIDGTLETVVQDSLNEPMRATRRRTQIELYKPESGKGTLYELGIPIQSIDCPYSANVLQKVPLPPNRDVVKDSYLQDIYRLALENTLDEITEASDSWIRQAVEDKETTPETVKAVMTKRYGDKAVLWSTDTLANERATEHGFTVVHPKTLSPIEREAMREAGLSSSHDSFGLTPASATYLDDSQLTEGMRQIAQYTRVLAVELIGRAINISFYKLPNGYASAEWTGTAIQYNVSKLGLRWFDSIGVSQTALVLHELAHVKGNGHDSDYIHSLADLAGEAVHLALNKPETFKV